MVYTSGKAAKICWPSYEKNSVCLGSVDFLFLSITYVPITYRNLDVFCFQRTDWSNDADTVLKT